MNEGASRPRAIVAGFCSAYAEIWRRISGQFASQSEQIEILLWQLWIIFLAIFPVIVANYLLDEIVEADLINFFFFRSAGVLSVPPGRWISAPVVSGIYYFGFACTATITFAVVLGIASFVVWCRAPVSIFRSSQIATWIPLFLLLWLVLTGQIRFSDPSGVGGLAYIARQLINNTLQYLPQVEDIPQCKINNSCFSFVGNTGSSIKDILGYSIGVLTASGLLYLGAICALVGSRGSLGKASALVRTLTALAAFTYVASVITVHLVFLPGRSVIEAAYRAIGSDFAMQVGLPESLSRYDSLSGAMVVYWGAVFSMSLAGVYFTAVACLSRRAGEIDMSGAWSTGRAIATTLLPLIGSGVAGVLQVAFESLSGASP